VMFEIIGRYVTETQLLRPLYQYLKRIEYTDGYYREVETPIKHIGRIFPAKSSG